MIPTMMLGLMDLTEDDNHKWREDRDLRGEDEKCRQADNQAQSFNLQVVTKFQGGSIKKRLQLKGVKVYADQIVVYTYIQAQKSSYSRVASPHTLRLGERVDQDPSASELSAGLLCEGYPAM